MHRPTRLPALAAALALIAVTTVACTVGSSGPPAGISCGWPLRSDRETLNVAYPDASATYFTTRYTLVSGQRLVLSGTYPFARYISLITYNLQGNAVDHLVDTAIQPDADSANPFSDPGAPTDPALRRWTVTVSPDAFAGSGQTSNLLAAGTNAGGVNVGSIILRVYVPDVPGQQAGGVPLPDLSVRNADGSISPIPTCTTQGSDPDVLSLINLFGPATDAPPTDPPVFKRPLTVAGLYPNPDNAYLAAIASYQPGRVVVVRGRAPTTPDTQAGQSPATPSQMRYWSFCTNVYAKPYPVTDCVFDHQVPLDGEGDYTFVVSTPAERPANATTADGVTWLDWGDTSTNLLLAFRNMLPDPGFHQSVFDLELGQNATDVMGPYAPVAVTCDAAAFEAGGAAACGLP